MGQWVATDIRTLSEADVDLTRSLHVEGTGHLEPGQSLVVDLALCCQLLLRGRRTSIPTKAWVLSVEQPGRPVVCPMVHGHPWAYALN